MEEEAHLEKVLVVPLSVTAVLVHMVMLMLPISYVTFRNGSEWKTDWLVKYNTKG